MSEVMEFLRENVYAYALVVLGAGAVVSAIADVIIGRILPRLTGKTKTKVDDDIIRAVRRPVAVTIFLLGASIAVRRLPASETTFFISDGIVTTLITVLWAGALLKIGNVLLDLMARRIDKYKVVQSSTLPLFEIALKAVVIGGALYAILLAWGVDVTAWLASAGIIGIAVGFAAKDTLANLFSGVFILADAPYKIGDFIILDSGERGEVTDIGIRSTRILTRDDIQIIIPNAAIGNAKIVNETGGPHEKERVRVKVGVAYGSDIDKVETALMEVARDSRFVSSDPEPRVRFRRFGDSSLDFELLGWIKAPVMRGQALHFLNRDVYRKFMEEGIVIPFPQRDVHLLRDENEP